MHRNRSPALTAVAVLLAAEAAARGVGSSISSGSGSGPAAKPGTCCVLHVLGEARSSQAEASAWQQVFADLKAKYCSVTATWQGQATGVPQLLNEAHLAGQPIDIVPDGTENWDFVKSGSLMDLTKLVSPYLSRFRPGTVDRFSLDNHVWRILISVESSSVFSYNQTLFTKLGFSAPVKFAQMVDAAGVIKSKSSVAPLVEDGKDAWEWPVWYMNALAQTSGNKSVNDTIQFLDGNQPFTAPA